MNIVKISYCYGIIHIVWYSENSEGANTKISTADSDKFSN